MEAVRLVMTAWVTLTAEVGVLVLCMEEEKTQTTKKSRDFTEQQ